MKILPISNTINISSKGRLAPKTCLMIGDIQVGLNSAFKSAVSDGKNYNNSQLSMTNKLANIFDNLNTIMERFCHGCELTFEQAEKSPKQRFYIDNKASHYKLLVCDTEMPRTGHVQDVESLEIIAKNLEKINPYEANLKFLIGKKFQADEKEFIPDADYMSLEDKLIID